MAFYVQKSIIYPFLCWTIVPIAVYIAIWEGFTQGAILAIVISLLILGKSLFWYREKGGVVQFLKDSLIVAIAGIILCLLFMIFEFIG